MYARSTTVKAQRDAIDQGIAQVRDEVLPAVMEMTGCVGLSMLVDRSSGECIVTTSWESQEAMHATAEMVKPLRDRATEILSGAASVQEWEVAVMHRQQPARPATSVRATWLSLEPGALDHALDVYRMTVLPGLQEMAGFCSGSLMVDRSNGMVVSTAAFTDPVALDAGRTAGNRLRESATTDLGAKVLDVHEYDLVLAHLHVPELV